MIILSGTFLILFKDQRLFKNLLSFWPTRLIFIYILVVLAWVFWALSQGNVTSKAVWYGALVNLRFLIFFLSTWVITAKSRFLLDNWQRIIFMPATFVAAFAILQYLVLPYDFLKHFGYSSSTIFPYETINHNIHHLRVASMLRGANPLGAYLVIPITALAVLLLKRRGKRFDGLIFGAGLLLALVFSFSRSAWIGLLVSLLIAGWLSFKSAKARRLATWALVAIAVVGTLMAVSLRHNSLFENTFLHTDHSTKIITNSNDQHAAAFKSGVEDIYHDPLGSGVGTAGPESFYNKKGARIAENYYLQVGQETGLIGMALFLAIIIVVGRLLWLKRTDPLALTLFASLIAISIINLLSHAWTDDTLAYIWWGLAGAVLAPSLAKNKHKSYD